MQVGRAVIQGEQGRRRQSHRQAVERAKKILTIAGGVIGAATRHQHDKTRRARADGSGDLPHIVHFLIEQRLQRVRLFGDFAFQMGLSHLHFLSQNDAKAL